jgi:hypothetical protein
MSLIIWSGSRLYTDSDSYGNVLVHRETKLWKEGKIRLVGICGEINDGIQLADELKHFYIYPGHRRTLSRKYEASAIIVTQTEVRVSDYADPRSLPLEQPYCLASEAVVLAFRYMLEQVRKRPLPDDVVLDFFAFCADNTSIVRLPVFSEALDA